MYDYPLIKTNTGGVGIVKIDPVSYIQETDNHTGAVIVIIDSGGECRDHRKQSTAKFIKKLLGR